MPLPSAESLVDAVNAVARKQVARQIRDAAARLCLSVVHIATQKADRKLIAHVVGCQSAVMRQFENAVRWLDEALAAQRSARIQEIERRLQSINSEVERVLERDSRGQSLSAPIQKSAPKSSQDLIAFILESGEAVLDGLVREALQKMATPAKAGGRPREWDDLWAMILELPDAKDAHIAKAYNQRYSRRAKKATAKIVREVRCRRQKKLAHDG
jgi:hypothetical protein